MPRRFRVAYFAHSLRSDWNNGNAHFLRGLLREMVRLGHEVTVYEPESEWSVENLRLEARGLESLEQFAAQYAELTVAGYVGECVAAEQLAEMDCVILHEWNRPELALALLRLREELGFGLVFHDTHHRASSSPGSIAQFGVDRFDGVLAFGESLRRLYAERFGMTRVWTLHEAADTSVFRPMSGVRKVEDVVWIGNWGDDERSAEIRCFLLEPAAALADRRFSIYGVRYPEAGLAALQKAGVSYCGYLPNLAAPRAYAAARLTVHVPRQQYAAAMAGIPTIRVFEALACGIPLISAPWEDRESLFREGDYLAVRDGGEMRRAVECLLDDPAAAAAQSARGLETVLARHTCGHRAVELAGILEELIR